MYACLYLCVYACIRAMCVCMYITYIYIYIYIYIYTYIHIYKIQMPILRRNMTNTYKYKYIQYHIQIITYKSHTNTARLRIRSLPRRVLVFWSIFTRNSSRTGCLQVVFRQAGGPTWSDSHISRRVGIWGETWLWNWAGYECIYLCFDNFMSLGLSWLWVCISVFCCFFDNIMALESSRL